MQASLESVRTKLNFISCCKQLLILLIYNGYCNMCEAEAQKKVMWRHLFTIFIVNFLPTEKYIADICMEHLFEKQHQQQQQQWMRPLFCENCYIPHWYTLGGGRLCCSYFIGKQNFEKSSRDFKISLPLPSAQFLMLLMKSNKIISCWFLLFIIWCALLLYVPYLWLLYFLIHLALIINFMLPRLFL